MIKGSSFLEGVGIEVILNFKLGVIGFFDFLVFKYCLENIICWVVFLKIVIMVRNDFDFVDFVGKVFYFIGCWYNGYVVCVNEVLNVYYVFCVWF